MSINQGKSFELHFKENWLKCFPNTFFYRLPDQMNGYLTTSQNPCDFIAFVNRKLFLLECKSHDGASIPFSAIPQYERLLKYKDLKYVVSGVIIWFKEKDRVIWVPIQTMEKLVNDGFKSIQLKILDKKTYNFIEIPATKKRVFMECDYSCLANLDEGW